MSNKLTMMQQRVFDVLFDNCDRDVPIDDLFVAAEYSLADYKYTRLKQQKIAPLLSRINAKLTHARIVPGELKRTYRLDTKNYKKQ